jgi:hypothetical protein
MRAYRGNDAVLITAIEALLTAIDNDHAAPRPLRLRLRLPRQRYPQMRC